MRIHRLNIVYKTKHFNGFLQVKVPNMFLDILPELTISGEEEHCIGMRLQYDMSSLQQYVVRLMGSQGSNSDYYRRTGIDPQFTPEITNRCHSCQTNP